MQSLKALNKKAALHDLELVKGEGYFYWVHPEFTDIPSVYVCHYSHMDAAGWKLVLNSAIEFLKGE